MTEHMKFPETPACAQWETLLADALDGLLRLEDESVFATHMEACPRCAELFDEARRGSEWLDFLTPAPEVPAGLLDKILARTGPGQKSGYEQAGALAMQPAWQQPGFVGSVRRFAEPRLLMTAAMAFFSITLTLNLTGIRLTELKVSDLRPTAVRSYMERRLTTASTPIVRYYDHMRLVYEVRTRVRELRRSTGNENNAVPQQNAAPNDPGQSKVPGKKKGGSRIAPFPSPRLPDSDGAGDFMESSLSIESGHPRTGGSATEQQERSTPWIA